MIDYVRRWGRLNSLTVVGNRGVKLLVENGLVLFPVLVVCVWIRSLISTPTLINSTFK